MIKFSKSMIATTLAASTILFSIGTTANAVEQDKLFTTIGELPPIDEFTNLPIEMTAAPLTEESISKYKVQQGDTVETIAAKFELDEVTLKKWNNLVDNFLEEGQTLSVEGQVEPTPEQAAKIAASQLIAEQAAKENATKTNVQQQQQQQQQPESNPQDTQTKNASNVITIANQYLGVPYVFGGTTPNGFDCSGYVSYVLKQVGKIDQHYNAASLYSISQTVSTPQIGDLVFFSGTYKEGISHVGIYVGDNKMINASGDEVQISNIYDSYWGKYFTGFGRI